MRKIETKSEKKKRQRRNQWTIGIILIFVMFGSVFGIVVNSFGGSQQKDVNNIKYNGFEFQKTNDYWYLTKGSFNFIFKYNPEEISNLSVNSNNLNLINSYQGKPLYIYSEDPEANLEVYRNFQNVAERMQNACFEASKCQNDWPLKDCTNNFIIIQKGNSSKIEQKDSCVFIEGKEEDLAKLSDEFIYKAIGVKQ